MSIRMIAKIVNTDKEMVKKNLHDELNMTCIEERIFFNYLKINKADFWWCQLILNKY